MSSANRDRRRQNRANRLVAMEEALRRTRRQRITFAVVGLALAVVVAIVLVSKATDNNGNSASKTTTPSTASTSSTASTTTTTLGSAAGKPCVAVKTTFPAGTPAVPVLPGPPPKKLVKIDLKVGTGAVAKPHATVTVNYVGVACSTGKVFDSSFARHTPFTTSLDGVVKGWTQGIPGMKVGGERLLGIPPSLAYGAQSPGSGIAPNETLWFVVDLQKTA
jgi:peptidylprolyl isomerase